MRRLITTLLLTLSFGTILHAQMNPVPALMQTEQVARQFANISVQRLGVYSNVNRLANIYVQQTQQLTYSVQTGQMYVQHQMSQWQNSYIQLQSEMTADWNARQDPYVNQAFQNLNNSQYQSSQQMIQYLNGGGRPGPGPRPYPGPGPRPWPHPGPGPGPQPYPGQGMWVCNATDAGWEEHGRGHIAEGRIYQQAYQRAEMMCRQAGHGRCNVRCNQR